MVVPATAAISFAVTLGASTYRASHSDSVTDWARGTARCAWACVFMSSGVGSGVGGFQSLDLDHVRGERGAVRGSVWATCPRIVGKPHIGTGGPEFGPPSSGRPADTNRTEPPQSDGLGRSACAGDRIWANRYWRRCRATFRRSWLARNPGHVLTFAVRKGQSAGPLSGPGNHSPQNSTVRNHETVIYGGWPSSLHVVFWA